jgi:hypothetical protein
MQCRLAVWFDDGVLFLRVCAAAAVLHSSLKLTTHGRQCVCMTWVLQACADSVETLWGGWCFGSMMCIRVVCL